MTDGFRFAFLLLVFHLLAGCATSVQLVPFPDQHVTVENPEKGRIYVVRDPNVYRFNVNSALREIRVLDGGVEIGSIAGQRGFLSWEREPGETTLSVPDEGSVTLTVEKGGVYYVLVRDELVGDLLPRFAGGLPSGTERMIVRLDHVGAGNALGVLAEGTPPKILDASSNSN